MMSDINMANPLIGGPPVPSRVIRPGINTLPNGTERYVVSGNGSLLLSMESDDRLTLVNLEGAQRCELFSINKKGISNIQSMFGQAADIKCESLNDFLTSKTNNTVRIQSKMAQFGFQVETTKGIGLFSGFSQAGECIEITVAEPGILLITSPSGIMDFSLQNTATPIEVFIKRANPKKSSRIEVVSELANPVDSFRIKARTAQSYTVKAGEYIQIIDAAGRQCTDFQVFDRRKVDAGKHLGLDATITRSLLGMTTPVPRSACKSI